MSQPAHTTAGRPAPTPRDRDWAEEVAGAVERGRRGLLSRQEPDGHWSQNMWLSGKAYWNGMQMDETALTVLLLDLARREGTLGKADAARFWPMVRRAASRTQA